MYPLVKLRYSEEVTQVRILYAREAERRVISCFEVLAPSVALVLFDSFTTSALILLRASARRFSYIAMHDGCRWTWLLLLKLFIRLLLCAWASHLLYEKKKWQVASINKLSDLSSLTHTQKTLLLRQRANNNNINSAAALLVGFWIITLGVDLDWSSLLLPLAVCGLFGDKITFRYLPILTGKE